MIDQAADAGLRATIAAIRRHFPNLLSGQKHNSITAMGAVLVSAGCNIASPLLIAHAIDTAIAKKDFSLLLQYTGVLAIISIIALAASYLQTYRLGLLSREVVFKLRCELFETVSRFSMAQFSQHRAGDLISRISSDTERVSQFFSESLVQFLSSGLITIGSVALVLLINWKVGLLLLVPAFTIAVLVRLSSAWVSKCSRNNLRSLGEISSEFHEGASNLKILKALNRIDYFISRFEAANERHFKVSLTANLASNALSPLYIAAGGFAQIIIILYGLTNINDSNVTIGMLIGYFFYANLIYGTLRQLSTVWPNLHLCLSSLERMAELPRSMHASQAVTDDTISSRGDVAALGFERVSFSYTSGLAILTDASFSLESGKTYAFVGPTGGGKTTIAMLMARLYDPDGGKVLLRGRDIRALSADERARRIGFILQDPILLSGTLRDNLVYGDEDLARLDDDSLVGHLAKLGLVQLLERFSNGLQTPVRWSGSELSLGEKQLIAFMRAVVREPEILILDEPTANVDTVTENVLGQMLERLPNSCTKVIIAHRLNTIRKADGIFFVGGGRVRAADSMDSALEMLFGERIVS